MKLKLYIKTILIIPLLGIGMILFRDDVYATPIMTKGQVYMMVNGQKKPMSNIKVVKSARDHNNVVYVNTDSNGNYQLGMPFINGSDPNDWFEIPGEWQVWVLSCKNYDGTIPNLPAWGINYSCSNFYNNYCPGGGNNWMSVSFCGLGCEESPNAWTPVVPSDLSFVSQWGLDPNRIEGYFVAVGESTNHPTPSGITAGSGTCVGKHRGVTVNSTTGAGSITFDDNVGGSGLTNYFCRRHDNNTTFTGMNFEFKWKYKNSSPLQPTVAAVGGTRCLLDASYLDDTNVQYFDITVSDADGGDDIEYLHVYVDGDGNPTEISDVNEVDFILERSQSGTVKTSLHSTYQCGYYVCGFYYGDTLPSTKSLYVKDDGTTMVSSSAPLNWRVKIPLSEMTYSVSGNNFNLRFPIQFSKRYGSEKNVKIWSQATDFQRSGWATTWLYEGLPFNIDMDDPKVSVFEISEDNTLSWEVTDIGSGIKQFDSFYGSIPANESCPVSCTDLQSSGFGSCSSGRGFSGTESMSIDSGEMACAVFDVYDACTATSQTGEGIPVGFPWFITRNGDFYSQGGAASPIMTDDTLSSYLLIGKSTDQIFFNLEDYPVGSKRSAYNWVYQDDKANANALGNKIESDLDELIEKVVVAKNNGGKLGGIDIYTDAVTFANPAADVISGPRIYYFNQDLTIGANITNADVNSGAIFFVDNGHTLTVSGNVTELNGYFIVKGGEFKVDLGNTQLLIKGGVSAYGCISTSCINLNPGRDLTVDNVTTPAEIIEYDPRYIELLRSAIGKVENVQYYESGAW